MQHFYDGQIRRYLTQIIRLMSNFSYKDGDGKLTQVPTMYGDITRQVASIIRDNSENKIPSAPRIGVYIQDLAIDRDRTADPTYTSKVHIRERGYDSNNNEYLNTQGKNYTVERLMPTPYNLTVKADIWSTNTDQKLQIMEQILMLFNPSLEIQTTDNYIDWTSLTVVNLDSVTFSSRSIPVGTESEIDVGSLVFSTPIYLSPPVKVKKMGVITNIITSMFNEELGTIEDGVSQPILNAYDDSPQAGTSENDFGRKAQTEIAAEMANVNYNTYGVFVDGDTAQLISNGAVGNKNWREIFEALPGAYNADVSRIFFTNIDNTSTATGTFTLNSINEGKIDINWDTDSFPSDTVIDGRTSIDYIIDPTNFNPVSIKTAGVRLLLLEDVGSEDATESPVAWQNADTTPLIASANDIVEWDGSKWNIVFDASTTTEITYTTNLNTNTQYRFNNGEWLLSIDGDYSVGTWRIELLG